MKKMIIVGIVSILAIGLAGCSILQSTEPTSGQPMVTEEPKPMPADTPELLEMEADTLTYKDEAVTFQYPAGWEITEQETTFEGSPHKKVVFTSEDSDDISVEFRQPILETAYMGWKLADAKSMDVKGFTVGMKLFEPDEEFAAEQGYEPTDEKASLTTLEDESGDYASSYQFFLVAPAENFDEYNQFAEMAALTFIKFQEGGGGLAVD